MAMTGGSIGVQVLGFVSSIILARLLEPTDFGVMRFAAVLVGTMNLFSGMGMGPAVVATSADRDRAAGHAFVLTMLSGSVLTLIVFVFAGPFAALMDRPDLESIFRVLSLRVLFATLFIVPNAVLAREMFFGRTAIAEVTSSLVRMGVAVTMAFAGFGVWSLVVGSIAEIATRMFATFALCPTLGWLRRARWDRTVAGGLWKFGFTQMRTGLVRYVYNNGDDMIVGKVLGVRALGFYTQSYSLSNLAVKNISMVVNGVLLPAYSKIRGDRNRLAGAFLSSFQFVSVLTVPLALGLFILAPDLIIALIGEKWRASIPVLEVFALMSLLRPLSGSTSPLFLALEHPEFNLRTALLQMVIMFALIPVFIGRGPTGVAIAVVSAFGIGFVFNIYQACWKTGLPLHPAQLLVRTWPVLVSAAGMTVAVWRLKLLLLRGAGDARDIFALIALVGAGALTYIVLMVVIGRRIVGEVLLTVEAAIGRRLPRGGAWGARLARWTSGRPRSGSDEPQWMDGSPPGLPAAMLDEAARVTVGAAPGAVRFQHLSSWKRSGAYRVAVQSGGARATLIYKEAAYGAGEIVALEGLPVTPGPPEFLLYSSAREALRKYLPAVHASEEVTPGRHYRYLFEDLGVHYAKSRDAGRIVTLCGRLPGIHRALADTVARSPRLRGRMLRFQAEFSRRLLGYAYANLTELAASRRAPGGLDAWLSRWNDVSEVYTRAFDRVHGEEEVAVHGDLNRANVLYHTGGSFRVKLIDWEWVGIGPPAFDLAALLKGLDEDTVARGLEAFMRGSHTPQENALGAKPHEGRAGDGDTRGRRGPTRHAEDAIAPLHHAFDACVLQRGLFDAAFFARQSLHTDHRGRLDLASHIRAALDRAQRAADALAGGAGSRQ